MFNLENKSISKCLLKSFDLSWKHTELGQDVALSLAGGGIGSQTPLFSGPVSPRVK